MYHDDRHVWEDERTVNVITNAVFSQHNKLSVIAMRFMLGQYDEVDAADDEDEIIKNAQTVKDVQLLHCGT